MKKLTSTLVIITITLAFHLAAGAQTLKIEGVVIDQNGAPVSGAEVMVLVKSKDASPGQLTGSSTRTTADGRFSFNAPAEPASLQVRASGFAAVTRVVNASDPDATHLRIVLEPLPLSETMTVTAARTETRLGDTAASVAVLSTEDLSSTAALTIDDALRQIPGFSLFRRSGSRTANPTSQGVSLRDRKSVV